MTMRTGSGSMLLAAGLAATVAGQVTAGEPNATPATDRAYLAELVADAGDRTSLLGADAGHDGHFFMGSADGNYRLEIEGQVQFRYVANFRDEKNGDDFDGGFQTRRTKIGFKGHAYDPRLKYEIKGGFERGNGDFVLEDAWVSWDLADDWTIRWGQFKLPFLREENTSSKRQLAVDRSPTNEVFNQDRAQGIQIAYSGERWRAKAAFSDGFKTGNTDFTSSKESDYALTGRVEVLAAGQWKQFKDFTSWRGSDFGALFGAAIHFQDSPNTNAPAEVNTQLLTYTADASLEGDGWNFYAAFIGRHITARSGGVDAPDMDDFGVVVQGGIFVTDDIELFARYDGIFPDSDRTLDDSFNTITFGGTYYFIPESHAAKLTADVQVFLDDTVSNELVKQNTGIGLLTDVEDSQVALRLQFQLLF